MQFGGHFRHFDDVLDQQREAAGKGLVFLVRFRRKIFKAFLRGLDITQQAVEELLPNPVGARLEMGSEAGHPLFGPLVGVEGGAQFSQFAQRRTRRRLILGRSRLVMGSSRRGTLGVGDNRRGVF